MTIFVDIPIGKGSFDPEQGQRLSRKTHCEELQMAEIKFLTAEEVSQRYRGEVTVGTLRNWRAMRFGPPFVKIGKAVLYPIEELDEWDKKNLVCCRSSRHLHVNEHEDQ